MTETRFLIIGSNSFSGSNCVNQLLKKGYHVWGVSRSKEPNKIFLPYKSLDQNKLNRFNFNRFDLNTDLKKILDLIDEKKISHIINFAAQGMVAESWKNPLNWFQTNLISQIAFHDELRKRSSIKKYVHFTTPEVYGDTKDKCIPENIHFEPSTPYAVSRAACDLHLQSFFKAYEFPVVFTRAANIYGPGQQLYRVIPRTILSCISGKKFFLHGEGLSERSFIHIEDTIDATIKIAENANPGECFHISTNEIISIKALVQKICNVLNVKYEDFVVSADERLGKDLNYFLDSKKLRNKFKWEEKYNLDQGILETINWIENNKKLVMDMPWVYEHKI